MRRQPTRPDRRGGFTLVELLVVITIIAILFSLTAAAVVKAREKADEVRTRNDISQLANAIQAFKTDFQAKYVPDRLVLPPVPPGVSPLDPNGESRQFISTVWPRISAATLTGSGNPFTLNGVTYQRGVFDYWRVPSNQPIVLQGYQTIVFFLGGSWDPAAGYTSDRLGFSTDSTDPMSLAGQLGAATRKGPYFDFPAPRLKALASDLSKTPANPFPAFMDGYGVMPYVYFSSGKAGNDYDLTYSPTPSLQTPGPQTGQVLATDTTTGFSVSPYKVSSRRFANPNGYQIIAAGRDGLFGSGDLNWVGAGGAVSMGGYDDVANFHPTLLGVPAQ